MNAEELRSFLTRRDVKFQEKAVDHGTQFRCPNGEVLNVFDKGTLQIQGKRTELTQAIEEWQGRPGHDESARGQTTETAASRPSNSADKRIFIVYGHDSAARESLELLLHRMDMEPIVLQNLPAAGDTIIEKLEHYLGEHANVGFACVLLTPDDEGYVAGMDDQKKYRARQNVILELGMVLSRLGRKKVAILHKESVELPSDIAGLIYIAFKERVDEVKLKLFQELQAAGYAPRSDSL